jgi:hypothetical protein
MIAMVGTDPQTGTQRWTLDTLYLWQQVPLVPMVLGLFALPELCDLAVARSSIASDAVRAKTSLSGMVQGAKDCFTHWWLVLRCSWLGSALGSIPGVSASVVDWLAYGHAIRTEKGAKERFGRGDVRGVIASESANNSREGGALVPTIAFGVPGSPGMAILIGAFLIHGLVPGPDMLSKHLSLTYSMVWSVALANVLGAGLCYAFSNQFARLATLRYTLILPLTLSLVYISAFQGQNSWGDFFVLVGFGVLGWGMKQLQWPRPPLILGIVLGDFVERYMFISMERYGFDWLQRPVVIVLFAIALVALVRPLLQEAAQSRASGGFASRYGPPAIRAEHIMYVTFILVLSAMLWQAKDWPANARMVPFIVGCAALAFCSLSLADALFRRQAPDSDSSGAGSIHMDVTSSTADLPPSIVARRSAIFFGWLLGFMASVWAIGMILTVPLFVILFMRIAGKEPVRLVLPQALVGGVFVYVVFHRLLAVPWPQTLLGAWLPQLKPLLPL